MPRMSSAALAVAASSPLGPARFVPPADLPELERRGFAA
jgi:hypothetical protein